MAKKAKAGRVPIHDLMKLVNKRQAEQSPTT